MARFSIQSPLTLPSNYDQVTLQTLRKPQCFNGVELDLNPLQGARIYQRIIRTVSLKNSAFCQVFIIAFFKCFLEISFFGMHYKLKSFRLRFLRFLLTPLGYSCHLKNWRYIFTTHKQILMNFFAYCTDLRRFTNTNIKSSSQVIFLNTNIEDKLIFLTKCLSSYIYRIECL